MPIPAHLTAEAQELAAALDLLTIRIETAAADLTERQSVERLAALKSLCREALALHERSLRLVLALHEWVNRPRSSDPP